VVHGIFVGRNGFPLRATAEKKNLHFY